MPRKTDLQSFGGSYEQLLLRAHAALSSGQDEFTVQLDAPNIAKSIRARVYSYFKAIRSSKDRPDLAALLDGISIRCAGSAMVFFKRGNELDEVALRRALGLEDGFGEVGNSRGVLVPRTGQSDAIEKLKRIRERK